MHAKSAERGDLLPCQVIPVMGLSIAVPTTSRVLLRSMGCRKTSMNETPWARRLSSSMAAFMYDSSTSMLCSDSDFGLRALSAVLASSSLFWRSSHLGDSGTVKMPPSMKTNGMASDDPRGI